MPSCCGKALPSAVLESVSTKEETYLVVNDGSQLPNIGSLRDSGYYENDVSQAHLTEALESFSFSIPAPIAPTIPVPRARHEAINIDLALANEAFESFRTQQKEQFERISTFECNQRTALSAHHQSSLRRLAIQHERSKIERTAQVSRLDTCDSCKLTHLLQHFCDLEHLEEMQLVAEHDLRQAQDQETQNVATALKHMEAYCLGTNANHPEHAHIVSQEDFKKLDRQRMIQQNLPRKFENAINVLRARQERQTKQRLQKQEEELDAMNANHEQQKAVHETEYNKEVERLESTIEARRKRLLQRWDLKFEMWRRNWEDQHNTTLMAKLEHEDWPLSKTHVVIPIAESSSLAQYVRAAA